MKNIYFEDEEIKINDLYFICYMIERIARHLHQKNRYVVNGIAKKEWLSSVKLMQMYFCSDPLQVEADWIKEYGLEEGRYDITDVDGELVSKIPSPLEMGEVYQRLIVDYAWKR